VEIIIDLDGTICTEERTFERSLAKPLPGAREAINKLRREGHTIIIYTARSWSEYKMTEEWLRLHSIYYDRLILGKPIGDVWIDDRSIKFSSWSKVLLKLNKK
jgi:hypothetical protein